MDLLLLFCGGRGLLLLSVMYNYDKKTLEAEEASLSPV